MNSEARTIKAEARNLIDWLSGDTTFAVPAYQRNYRWEEIHCNALLESIIQAGKEDRPYFLGSILSTKNDSERTLVDGQQRLITLTLLLVALLHSGKVSEQEKGEIEKILFYPDRTQTRIRPFKERVDALNAIVFRSSTEKNDFLPNYQVFEKGLKKEDASIIWKGIHQLECVDIEIQTGEKDSRIPQQVFESLNSTGKPLNDAELINNFILMPFSNVKFQDDIEANFWLKIEANATRIKDETQGKHLTDFFRHYLSLERGEKVEARNGDNEHNVFATFKDYFRDRLNTEENLEEYCQKWLDLSECYHLLLNPEKEEDEVIQEYLVTLNKFGESAYPFLMAVLNDYKSGRTDGATLRKILHWLETYFFRRNVCGLRIDHSHDVRMAALYKKILNSNLSPLRRMEVSLFLHIPTNDAVEQALQAECKGHAIEILAKIDRKTHRDFDRIKEEQESKGVKSTGIDLEHIFPQNPTNSWSDGNREWKNYSETEKDEMRKALDTIGNYTLLEAEYNRHEATNNPFPDKKVVYKKSVFEITSELQNSGVWDIRAIRERTMVLTKRFLSIWKAPRPAILEDAQNILEITEAIGNRKPDLNRYEMAWFQGIPLQVNDTQGLAIEICKILIKRGDADFLLSEPFPLITRNGSGKDIRIDNDFWLIGYFPHYILSSLQQKLADMGLAADQCFVKIVNNDK